VAGRVDDVHAELGVRCAILAGIFLPLPEGGGRSRGDRDATLLLLLHPVHRGSTIMNLTEVVGLASIEQDPFAAGGLACIDMGHDAEIAVAFERIVACHGAASSEYLYYQR